MGRSCTSSSRLLLFCFLLVVFSKNAFGRKLMDAPVSEYQSTELLKGKIRNMIELDYADAGPNFNGRSAYSSPSLPPPPPPSPPLPSLPPQSQSGD